MKKIHAKYLDDFYLANPKHDVYMGFTLLVSADNKNWWIYKEGIETEPKLRELQSSILGKEVKVIAPYGEHTQN